MEKTVVSDKRSIKEISNLIDFCTQLVIKDEDIANQYETTESMKNGYKLINAMLRADTLDDYVVTRQDLQELDTDSTKYSVYSPNNLPDEYKDIVLEYKRFQVYKNYYANGETNTYYKNIYDTYFKETDNSINTLKEFMKNSDLTFFVSARLYKQFSLLWYPTGILSSNEILKFKKCYTTCQTYFLQTCYNEAYKVGNEKYNNLCMLMIVYMTIKRYLSMRLENIDDIDFFDEYSIRNMFLSYGLDYFFDMPLKYQRRILKNINFLIRNKGTNKAIINILELFGFSNIKIMKYFLCKEYPKDDKGNLLLNKAELKFYGIDTEETNIENVIKNSMVEDYEKFTESDKYWQVSKWEEDSNGNKYLSDDYKRLLAEPFNYIYTKYISIEGIMDINKAGLDFAYCINYLYQLEEKFRTDESYHNYLYFYDYNISNNKINLIHAIFLLFILVMKKTGYKDNIVKTSTGIMSVLDFNFKEADQDLCFYKELINHYKVDLSDYVKYIPSDIDIHKASDKDLFAQHKIVDVEYIPDDNGEFIIKKELDITNSELLIYKLCYLEKKTINNFKKENLLSFEKMKKELTKKVLVDAFKANNEFRRKLENMIVKTNDRRLYRKYQVLYKSCFIGEYRSKLFEGYDTFTEYLKVNDKDLYLSLNKILSKIEETPADEETIYNEYILEICNSIDSFLDDDAMDFFIQGNIYLNDYIKDFIYQLVDFIRSYTVHIKEISTIYLFDEKFLNTIKFFDEKTWITVASLAELKPFEDRVSINNTEILTPEDLFEFIQTSYKFLNKIEYSDYLKLKEIFHSNVLSSIADLLKVNDKEKIENIVKYIEGYELSDKYKYNSKFLLSTKYTFNDFIKNIEDISAKLADLNKLNDKINFNNEEVTDIWEVYLNEKLGVSNIYSIRDKLSSINDSKPKVLTYLNFVEKRLEETIKEKIKIVNEFTSIEQINTEEALIEQDITKDSVLLFKDTLDLVKTYEDLHIVKYDLKRLVTEKIYIKRQDEMFYISELGNIEYYISGENNGYKRHNYIYKNGNLVLSKQDGEIKYVAMSRAILTFELLNIIKGDLNNE